MENRSMTCINCPMGCQVNVAYEIKDGKPDPDSFVITGNTCPRGKDYAISEMTAPTRTVTGTVSVKDSDKAVLPVKTVPPVSKDMVLTVAKELEKITVTAPISIGDVILSDVCGTGSNIVATGNLQEG